MFPIETIFDVSREWTTIRQIDKRGSDGQAVAIDEVRMPARFYRLRALPSTDSLGQPIPGFALSTGSGTEMLELMTQLGLAIANGMVGLSRE